MYILQNQDNNYFHLNQQENLFEYNNLFICLKNNNKIKEFQIYIKYFQMRKRL